MGFLSTPWVQGIFWLAGGVVVLQFRAYMKGGGTMWTYISVGLIIYAVRVAFKLLPFYSNGAAWPQVIRYGLGIIAALFVIYGFIEYFYKELQPTEEIAG